MLEDYTEFTQTMSIRDDVDFQPVAPPNNRLIGYSIGVCLTCLVVTIALLVLSVPKAMAAGEQVILRTNVYLSDNVITVGDVFENAGAHADHVLAPAPAVGTVMELKANDLQRIARAFKFNWSPSGHMDMVTLQRAATEIEKSDIVRFVEQEIAKKIGSDANVEVAIQSVLPRLVMNGLNKPELKTESLEYSYGDDRFNIVINARTNEGSNENFRVSGRVFRVAEVPVLSVNIKRGDKIRKEDIETYPIRQDLINQSIALSPDDLIGMVARRSLTSNRPIRMADLERARMVTKGETITMVLRNGGMTVTSKGRALDHGALGDVIRVLNMASNRVVDAEVAAPQKAVVELRANRI